MSQSMHSNQLRNKQNDQPGIFLNGLVRAQTWTHVKICDLRQGINRWFDTSGEFLQEEWDDVMMCHADRLLTNNFQCFAQIKWCFHKVFVLGCTHMCNKIIVHFYFHLKNFIGFISALCIISHNHAHTHTKPDMIYIRFILSLHKHLPFLQECVDFLYLLCKYT